MTNKKQILVVEDNWLNREMLVEILSEQYTVYEAENGQEALDMLRLFKASISLVLLDIIMPVMDGYTFLDKLKDEPDLSIIPVIVITQSEGLQDEVAALAHGATDFVTKPYNPEVVLHRIANMIHLRETSAMINYLKYDRLTGLYSKEYFYQIVREKLDENPTQAYTIICSDIENFKIYNNTFGREDGNHLLKKIADVMLKMSGEDGICGRYGADCFLCFKEREKEPNDWRMFFENSYVGRMDHITMKWGIYEIDDRSIPVEQMCDQAMMVVNSIKGHFDKHYAVYDDSIFKKKQREQNITNTMEIALNEEQFDVYFQPKYDLHSGEMVAAEALARWTHPELGFISPGEFIHLFEKNGFITLFDKYIWKHACIMLKKWKDKEYPIVPISVNVSREDLYCTDLVDTLLELTRRYEIEPEYLHLEITESAYTENLDEITDTVEKLRKLNFFIEMDDFGSGYSTLNMFSKMRMDILKLDMKFVQNETKKTANQSILNDIINMAHRMCLKVVAEGVESKDQVNRLKKLGCDYAQGYFFSKPLPAPEFEQFLKKLHVNPLSEQKAHIEPVIPGLLIADEDAVYRKSIHKVFEYEYRIHEAENTDSALAVIHAHGAKGISAVILSSSLPDNGAAVILKTLRQDPVYWNVPILATIPAPSCKITDPSPLALETDDFICKYHPVADLHRRVEHMIEVAELEQREKFLIDQVCRDPMTGLLNRRGLKAAMEAIHTADLPVALCLFDLDNLKIINDTFGHKTGDHVIQVFSEFISHEIRSNDVVCRFGGDEFVLILMNITDSGIIKKRIETICRKFKEKFTGMPFYTSCSVGVVVCGANEKPSAQTIEHADQAMYRAKQENKGCCYIWNDAI